MASPSHRLDPGTVAALGPAVRPLLQRGRPSSAPGPGRAAIGRFDDPAERQADGFARAADGPLAALSSGERAALEAVRVHTGAAAAGAARALGARAFALGNQIVFGEGEYRPGSADGRALLAHELHHVFGNGAATLRRQPLGTGTVNDQLPAPVTVTWSTDQFEVSFERAREGGSTRLVFAVRYLGKRGTEGPFVRNATQRLGVMIGEAPLRARVLGSDTTSLTVDLYGDGRNLVRLVDRAQLDTRPQRKGREHDLETVVDYTVQATASLWVLDPAAIAGQITDAPREERPELWPQAFLVFKPGHNTEVVLDGDGDGDKELELQMQPTEYWPEKDGRRDLLKTLRVDVIQRSTGTLRSLTFSCPELTDGGSYFPIVTEVTDGLAPTRINLVMHADGCVLQIAPGRHTATESRYRLSVGGQAQDAVFGPDPRPKRKVAQATGAEAVGGIVSLDLTLGAYRDPFRITLRRLYGHEVVFGLTAVSDGRPSGGGGAELSYNGPLNARLIDTGQTSIGVDLNDDGHADLMLYDQLTPGRTDIGHTPLDNSRHHRVRVAGPAITGEPTFDFTYWPGGAGRGAEPRTDADREAVRNADAAGILAAETKGGGRAEQLDQLELQAISLRQGAIGHGALRQATYDALLALWQVLVQARAERGAAGQGQVSAATQSLATAAGDAFGLEYLRELDPASFNQQLDMIRLTGAIRTGAWAQVFDVNYPAVTATLDAAIAGRLEDKFGKAGARELTTVGNIRDELRALPGNAIRVPASYHPDQKFATESGYVSAVPLQLYAWLDGDTWRLRNVTNPDKHVDYDAHANPGEKTPGMALFGELNDIDHFPAGVIYWAVPGGMQGETPVRDHLTWKKGLTYLGLAVAVVGITLATAGAGTQAAVYGAYALAASALLGAAAAGMDLVEHIKRDDLDATTALLDLSQVAAGLTGAGALISGRIIVEAGSAVSGARFVGDWARLAKLAQQAYVPLTIATKVADVTTVLVMAVDTASRIEQISHDPNIKPEDRTQAVFLLLSQAAVLGGLTALSMKGTISAGRGETLVITRRLAPQGQVEVPVVSRALGKQTVIIDSQLVILAEREARVEAARARGLAADERDILDPGEQLILDKFRARADVDIRVADKTAEEVAEKGGIAPHHGFGVAVDRASAEYKALEQQLTDLKVGGGKGTKDRSIVADAFFGVTEQPGMAPTLVTGDGKVYKRLYDIAQARPGSGLKPLDKLGKALPQAMPGGFDVTVGNRTLHVIPL
jgi:hypothetical protein